MNKLKVAWLLLGSLMAFQTYGQKSENIALEEIIRQSVESSKQLKTEQTNVEIAKSRYQSVKDARLPEVSASGQIMYLPYAPNIVNKLSQPAAEGSTSSSQGFPIPKTVSLGSINASMPLFTGFKLKNSITQADLGVEMSQIAVGIKTEQVALQTIELYYAIYKTKATIQVLEENIGRAKQRVTDYGNFVQNGLLAENDLLKAKLMKSNLEINLEDAKNSYENLLNRLNIYLNTKYTSLNPQLNNIQKPISPDSFLERKDLSLLNKKIEQSAVNIELARANYYPQVALTGGFINAYIPNLFTVTNALNFGIGVKYNISSLYKNKSEMKTANLQKFYSEQKLEEAKDQAQIETLEAKRKYLLTLKKQEVYEEAFGQAKENLRIVNNKYENGLADTDQVMDAEIQLLQSEINKKVGVADQEISWYQWLQATGMLLENFKINQ